MRQMSNKNFKYNDNEENELPTLNCFEGILKAVGGEMEIDTEKICEMDEHENFIDNMRILKQ